MSDLVSFLAARLDEDEAAAKRAAAAPAVQHEGNEPGDWSWLPTFGQPQPDMYALIDHQTRFDPARVLREVAAKRAIVELHHIEITKVPLPPFDPYTGQPNPDEWAVGCAVCGWASDDPMSGCPTLRYLATIYSGHPDYPLAPAAPPPSVGPRDGGGGEHEQGAGVAEHGGNPS